MAELNPFLLAAAVPTPDARLLPLLRARPTLAAQQDEHGYSLVHAAASYGHAGLLRTLAREFGVDVDVRDEDGETALFVAETREVCRCLVEELGADATLRNDDGLTAREKAELEPEFPDVLAYLRALESGGTDDDGSSSSTTTALPPSLPANVSMTVSTVDAAAAAAGTAAQEPDPEFRRRIEELAARDDFQTEDGQRQLRELITDAVRGATSNDRDVRQRLQ